MGICVSKQKKKENVLVVVNSDGKHVPIVYEDIFPDPQLDEPSIDSNSSMGNAIGGVAPQPLNWNNRTPDFDCDFPTRKTTNKDANGKKKIRFRHYVFN